MKPVVFLSTLLVLNFVALGVYIGIGAALGWVAEWMVGTSHYGDWYRYGGAAGLVYGTVVCLRATLQTLAEGAKP